MAFQPVPDTAGLRFKFAGNPGGTVADLVAYFTLYVRQTPPPGWTSGELQRLADYGGAWWSAGKNGGATLRSFVNASWGLSECRATDLEVSGGGQAVHIPGAFLGTRSGEPVPPQAPALVQLFGDAGGEPIRGRVFFSFLSETDIIADEYLATPRTGLAQIFEDFRADIGDVLAGGQTNWAQVLVSRSEGTVVDPKPKKVAVRRVTAVTNTLSAAATVRPVTGSQRNRRSGE